MGKINLKNDYGQYPRRIIETTPEILLDVLDTTIGRWRARVFTIYHFENRVCQLCPVLISSPHTHSVNTQQTIFSHNIWQFTRNKKKITISHYRPLWHSYDYIVRMSVADQIFKKNNKNTPYSQHLDRQHMRFVRQNRNTFVVPDDDPHSAAEQTDVNELYILSIRKYVSHRFHRKNIVYTTLSRAYPESLEIRKKWYCRMPLD